MRPGELVSMSQSPSVHDVGRSRATTRTRPWPSVRAFSRSQSTGGQTAYLLDQQDVAGLGIRQQSEQSGRASLAPHFVLDVPARHCEVPLGQREVIDGLTPFAQALEFANNPVEDEHVEPYPSDPFIVLGDTTGPDVPRKRRKLASNYIFPELSMAEQIKRWKIEHWVMEYPPRRSRLASFSPTRSSPVMRRK